MSHPLKIGLFGGSFNPPTIAHLALAQHAHDVLNLDQVWWLVAPHNPDKPKHTLAPFADRMTMCELTAHGYPWLIVSDWEARLGTQQTANTLNGIRQHHPHDHFVWLMGTDNLLHFHNWDNWTDIYQTVPVAVFSRPGDIPAHTATAAHIMGTAQKPEQAVHLQAGQWMVFNNTDMPISATNVRAKLAKGETSDHILPAIATYIRQHGLYRPV